MKVRKCLMEKLPSVLMPQVPNLLCSIKGFLLLLFLNVNYVTSESKCFIVTITSLKHADCRSRHLKIIPGTIERDIKVLMFQENDLTILKENEFVRYILLQRIDLTRNQIATIQDNAFKGLENLQSLDLEGNKLSEIPALAIARLTSLRTLSLKSNKIKSIPNNSLSTLKNLQELNFENNYIKHIDPLAFLGLNNLQQLNIVKNQLMTLNIKMNNTLSTRLEMVRLHDNPWHCDCHLRWFRELLETQPISWQFYEKTPRCETPEIIHDTTWKQLGSSQFACAAKSNVKKNSTSIQLIPGNNVTIDCFVKGDPIPKVSWFKNEVSLEGVSQARINIYNRPIDTTKPGELGVRSTLTILNATEDFRGDYKCLAVNGGGTSEVTYNVWVKGVQVPSNEESKPAVILFGLSREVFLAILISAGLLIVIFFVMIIVCILVKQNRNKHAYKVWGPQRQSNNVNNKKERGVKVEKVEETPVNHKDSSKSDRKHLLATKSKEASHQSNQNPIKRDESSKPLTQTDKIENSDNEFRMKIFASYEDEEANNSAAAQESKVDNPTTVVIEAPDNINQTPPDTNQRPPTVRLQRDTPDLLKDRIITNRAIPVPPPSVPNHISSVHPRAKENPYVTASELKAASMKRKTASADDLLDSKEEFDGSSSPGKVLHKRSSSRDDLRYLHMSDYSDHTKQPNSTLKKTRFKEPLVKPKDHASTCTNPVCQKDQLGLMDKPNTSKGESAMKPYKPIINVRKKGGGQREIDVDQMYRSDPRTDYDTYRTMPARMSQSRGDSAHRHYSPPGTSQSSPAKSPLNQRYLPPATKRPGYVPTKTVSFSEEGHPIIDLTQEMPEPIVISGCKPDSISSDYGNKRYPQTTSSTLPRLPPQHVQKSPLPNGSPPRKNARGAQCTTLDDLLSPPFGQSPKSQRHQIRDDMKAPKRVLKPGEKDEFGTAV